jgi:superkiller protein 3
LSGFSFSTTIQGIEHEYTIRSVNFESIRKIIINLNERDRVLNTQETPYNPNQGDEELMAMVKHLHEERVEVFRELIRISKKLEKKPDANSNYKLGMVLLKNGMGKEAITEFRRALTLEPDKAPVLKHLGVALILEERYGEAIKNFQRAIEIKPTYPDIHNNLALAFLRSENYPEALNELEKALEIHPKYAEAQFNLGLCLVSQAAVNGKLDEEAQEKVNMHLSQAVELNASFNNEYYKISKGYLAKGRFAEARQALVEARTAVLSQSGSEIYNEFYLRLKYGEEGVDRKSTERYISKLEDILEKNPNYVDIHNDLGVAYLIQCRFLFTRAINEFKKALTINADYAKAKKNLKLAENEGKGFLILLRAILYF